jgi:sulfite reductase alpha subunit-like flavoprotein
MVMDPYQVSQKIWRYQAGNQKTESKDRQYNGQKKKEPLTKHYTTRIRPKKSLKIPKGGNQYPCIEEKTTQWPKEKIQKDKQQSTKHTYKTKDRVTRTPLKTGGELKCSGRVGSSCSNSYTRRFTLVTNPVASHERGECVHLLIMNF